MTLFLTSHIGGSVRKDGQRIPSSLITDNNLVNNLKTRWPEQAKVMFIAANPNNDEAYRIRDGQISMICKNDESRIL